jgi:hypothetical protein
MSWKAHMAKKLGYQGWILVDWDARRDYFVLRSQTFGERGPLPDVHIDGRDLYGWILHG